MLGTHARLGGAATLEFDLGFAAAIKRLFPTHRAAPPPRRPLHDRRIESLVRPLCKGKLVMLRDAEQRPTALACHADRLAFPIRDGIR